jgi:hypothetical protein
MRRPPKAWSPSTEQRRFIRRYAQAIASGDVAIFAGAGLSRAAGYVDWKGLLREIANDLKLDIDRETDLIAVAQYHLNERRSRARIHQAIVDELSSIAEPTRGHDILARLPMPAVWTTNYDQLLERAFEKAGKIVDLKLTQENLAQTKRGRDVVVYKMHGCVSQPQDAVVTKDDYEQYESKRPLFVESLKGDLISKTFLFLGFSFTDPNIEYILSRVRVLLGTNIRDHFCIMRSLERPRHFAGRKKAEYEYEHRRLSLRQSDLHRFGIETVWIDEYDDAPLLLEALSSFIHRKSVFVSGAAYDPNPLGRDRLNQLAQMLGERLIKDGYNLISGFGVGLGEQCVVGSLRALYGIPKGADVERLLVRPFPRASRGDQPTQNRKHREDLIARAGSVVVISGNRDSGGSAITSPGVLEEVEIARREKKPVIPIGASGHAAHELWTKAIANPQAYLPNLKVSSELTMLGNRSATNDELLNALFSILSKVEKAATV